MAARARLVRGFLTVGGWTFFSRIMGFVRDMIMAAYLGTGPVAQAFIVAFTLPNLFRRFFAEGAFNTAFVPLFAKKLESGDDPQGFASDAFSGLALVVLGLTLVATLAMPLLVLAQASGFHGDQRFALAVVFARICFPYILLVSLAALISGVLNTAGRFAAAAAAPVTLNFIFIAAMWAAAARGWPMGLALAIATPVAGAVQLGLVWWAAGRAGFHIRLRRPRLTPDLRRLLRIAGPAVLAGGVVQINLLIGRQVASFFDHAISWLYNADRLYQLPLGVVGIAIGVVLLPDLARRLKAGDEAGGRHSFSRAVEFGLFLTLPAAVALIVIAHPLVQVLFERGAFTAEDSRATALALTIYGLGLPAFVLQKLLQPLYFAREDTRRPFRFAVQSMVATAAVAVGLAPLIGFTACAWGTTIAAWVMVVQLWRGSRAMGAAASIDARARRRCLRTGAASVLMGGVLALAAAPLAPWLALPGLRAGALALLIALGILSYGLAALGLGAITRADLARAVRRSPRAGA